MVRLVLASSSPQRREILEQLRIPFEVRAPSYVERDPPGTSPVDLVRSHADGKARSVHVADGRLTLGVDTAVHLDGRIFGKPGSRGSARRMLRALCGRAHEVVSGLCLLGPGFAALEHERTRVIFRSASAWEIESYLESDEWKGRAGAYAIQGLGARLVAGIEGDYLNVVGLPGAKLVALLERHAEGLLRAGLSGADR